MRLLVRALPVLLLCARPAYAIDPNDLPDGWWAPTLAACRTPETTTLFEVRLKAQAGGYLDSSDNRCRITRVSDTAIGYRLDLRCYASQADREGDINVATRQVVVDAIGPITMRADGKRVYRCAGRAPSVAQALVPKDVDSTPAPVTASSGEAKNSVASAPVNLPPSGVPIRHAALSDDPTAIAPADPAIALPIPPLPAPPSRPIPLSQELARAVTRGQIVAFAGSHPPGTIIVRTKERALYLVQGDGKAIRYRVAVGRPGAAWSGVETVSAKLEWPSWTPTPEMRRRRPGLRTMRGGPSNPLGARALYLGTTAYRIHGTTDPGSIGRAASSGCIRMLNSDVIELYERVPVGTRVEVL
ncbi:L,D-transpeptidase [Methylobacterium sp. Leaf118]|uniref:L,D-transpeptidase n=1 Tax=Methylobacterium sp. Leaf118 TaxID=2876562 RepID=UPI002FCCCEA1